MNKRSNKKGFTLVELLVVIAILAILATVSVVGYLSFTEKAKESNDETLIAQLNTALQADEAVDGKPTTMHDALQVVEEAGFNVEKLTPTSSKNEFLWNQETNRFEIVKVDTLGTGEANPDLWIIVDTQKDLTKYTVKYSVYLSSAFTTTETTVNLINGFDAGEFSSLETINYNNQTDTAKNVTIRTNSGTLSVNARLDTINHYGELNSADISAVDLEHSYHEYGNVKSVAITSGHIVDESGSIEKYEVRGNNVSITTETDNKVLICFDEGASTVVFNENTLVKDETENTIVVDKDNNKYESKTVINFKELNSAIENDCYIIIGDSFVAEEALDILEGVEIVIDLNGKSLTVPEAIGGRSKYIINNYGRLVVKDSSLSKTGVISSRGIQVLENGYMLLESGRIESIDSNGGGAAVWNEAYFEMTGGTLAFTGSKTADNSAGSPLNVRPGAKATITGGELISPYTCIFSSGDLTVKNITLESETSFWMTVKIDIGGNATLENVNINTINGGCIENAGGEVKLVNCNFQQIGVGNPAWNSSAVATSNGGVTIVESGYYAAYQAAVYVYTSGGTVTINGGTFIGKNDICLQADESKHDEQPSIIIANGGKFVGGYTVGNKNASLTINGGNYTVNPGKYLSEDKIVNELDDGTFEVK